MKTITGNTVELNEREIDAHTYFHHLLNDGKGIVVAAFWALRASVMLGRPLTTEFALYISEGHLVMSEEGFPVPCRFAPLGEDQVIEWLAEDPQIAAVTEGKAMLIAAEFDLDEPLDVTEPFHVGGPLRRMSAEDLTGNPEPVFSD